MVARQVNPLERIMEIRGGEDGMELLATDEKLAHPM
jgi:hypothetical protein